MSGDVRATFVDASVRSCLKSQIDNQSIPVLAIVDYCKCYSNGLADKISNDEVKALEASRSEQKYAAAVKGRVEAAQKLCFETMRKNLTKPN